MKKRRSYIWYLVPLVGLFVALAIVLYFVNPVAPLFLLASLAIQVPIILFIARAGNNAGYKDRLYMRRMEYIKNSDAEEFLASEEREANSLNFRFLSAGNRMENLLTRAELLLTLHREEEARALHAQILPSRLNAEQTTRYNALFAENTEAPNLS